MLPPSETVSSPLRPHGLSRDVLQIAIGFHQIQRQAHGAVQVVVQALLDRLAPCARVHAFGHSKGLQESEHGCSSLFPFVVPDDAYGAVGKSVRSAQEQQGEVQSDDAAEGTM
ncbi:hypothetical protein D3227_35655 [Mesorhizobium waimense]|uniref:Uncharacterized protein n=1 Tax=Mesorhizobium waimense TaxID=1300307 RepID=A0A3A5JXM9_9HYPH|nr:hypothetical protein D3227_35655 [Mesorhizobium waimense]